MTLLPINLPKDLEILVSKGQKVINGQVLAQRKSISKDNIIHLSNFGISTKELKSSLKKNLGDKVVEGDTLAVKKKLFGGEKILSSTSGTMSRIDEQNCDIYLKSEKQVEGEKVISPVEGTVDFCNNEQIVIKTAKNAVVAKDAFGKDAIGKLLLIKNANSLSEEVEGKIIAVNLIDRVFLYKALSLGAIGIVATDFDDLDFIEVENTKIDGAVILLDPKEFSKLEKENGNKILVDVKGKAILFL